MIIFHLIRAYDFYKAPPPPLAINMGTYYAALYFFIIMQSTLCRHYGQWRKSLNIMKKYFYLDPQITTSGLLARFMGQWRHFGFTKYVNHNIPPFPCNLDEVGTGLGSVEAAVRAQGHREDSTTLIFLVDSLLDGSRSSHFDWPPPPI